MKTSKQPFALLFCKEGCAPCDLTKAHRDEILEADPTLCLYLSTLTVRKDSVWRETYNLDKFPTLIVVDDNGSEQERITGGKNIRSILHGVLTSIRQERRK